MRRPSQIRSIALMLVTVRRPVMISPTRDGVMSTSCAMREG
jgi:hypothetical protein